MVLPYAIKTLSKGCRERVARPSQRVKPEALRRLSGYGPPRDAFLHRASARPARPIKSASGARIVIIHNSDQYCTWCHTSRVPHELAPALLPIARRRGSSVPKDELIALAKTCLSARTAPSCRSGKNVAVYYSRDRSRARLRQATALYRQQATNVSVQPVPATSSSACRHLGVSLACHAECRLFRRTHLLVESSSSAASAVTGSWCRDFSSSSTETPGCCRKVSILTMRAMPALCRQRGMPIDEHDVYRLL